MSTGNFLLNNIKANPLVWTTTLFSSILLALNVWLTYRLVPVEQSIRGLNSRIEAIEQRNENLDPLIERFYKVEEKQKSSEDDITEIKETLVRMDGKLDRAIQSK